MAASREYSLLLSHLHNDESILPLAAIQNALAHHLAHLQPLPTPLAATAVSAPLYLSQPLTHEKLQSLATAFRYAILLKLQALEKRAETQSTIASLFTGDLQSATAQWTIDVVRGFQGGQPVMRLTCLTGLLLGIEDIKKKNREQGRVFDIERGRNVVENELVISAAETVDSYAVEPKSDWEREFIPASADPETLSLSLILASQCLPLVSRTRLKVLPLSVLNRMLVSAITETFQAGTFLSFGPSTSVISGTLPIQGSYAKCLKTMMSSPAFTYMAALSKLTALTVELMLDTRSQHMQQAMETAIHTLSAFEQMAKAIEANWISSPLPGRKDEDMGSTAHGVTKDLWSILKTFLFSTVMVVQAPLSSVVYTPPYLFAPSTQPQHLSLSVLNTLYYLSFVVSEFGGISPDSGSFTELKRTTYLALDILTQEPKEAEVFVRQICLSLGIAGSGQVQQSKKEFALVCLEQLVPVLSTECVKDLVWGVCYPHLSDTSHRELYESAHSVILTILVSHTLSDGSSEAGSPADFVTRIIPFYAQCLIENSGYGKLGTTQIQLAYSALVRSATAQSTHAKDIFSPAALAWYCVEILLDAIQGLSDSVRIENKDIEKDRPSDSHLHRLHLTLIATVSSLPLSSMLHLLDKIRDIILEDPPYLQQPSQPKACNSIAQETKTELMGALSKEILERVGDGEKEAVMRWWYANLGSLEAAVRGEQVGSSNHIPNGHTNNLKEGNNNNNNVI